MRLGLVKRYPLVEAEIEKGVCVEMRVGKCIKFLKVEEIGDIDIYDGNATIMLYSVIYKM